VHLVGFIIRIYHDARSPERQIRALLRLPGPLLRVHLHLREGDIENEAGGRL